MVIFIYAFFIYGWFGTPVFIVWSWSDWIRKPRPTSISGHFAFAGLVIASISVLFFVGVLAYRQSVGGFLYTDPRLLHAYQIGLLVSLAAVGASLGGIWQPSSLRWLSPIASIGTLLLWLCTAASE